MSLDASQQLIGRRSRGRRPNEALRTAAENGQLAASAPPTQHSRNDRESHPTFSPSNLLRSSETLVTAIHRRAPRIRNTKTQAPTMARGNQRDKAREKNQKKLAQEVRRPPLPPVGLLPC